MWDLLWKIPALFVFVCVVLGIKLLLEGISRGPGFPFRIPTRYPKFFTDEGQLKPDFARIFIRYALSLTFVALAFYAAVEWWKAR